MQHVTGKVVQVHRHGHTVYGNPIISINLQTKDGRYEFESFRISDNASLVYEIDNPIFKDEFHTFELTRAGRISGRYSNDAQQALAFLNAVTR